MPLYRDVCSPWDIVRFQCIQKQFFTVPLALLEGLTVFSVSVLVSNLGQDTDGGTILEIGMIAQVTAIQPVMDQPSRSPVDPSMLPEHLRDLLDRTSEGLEDLQRG